MSDEIMNIEGRWKIWGGFLKLMSYSGIAIVIALLIMWWGLWVDIVNLNGHITKTQQLLLIYSLGPLNN